MKCSFSRFTSKVWKYCVKVTTQVNRRDEVSVRIRDPDTDGYGNTILTDVF